MEVFEIGDELVDGRVRKVHARPGDVPLNLGSKID
jgi:hypothetical protein